MLNTLQCRADLQETFYDAEEELFLMRCALRCLLVERSEGRELWSLWRLLDYLEQHITDIRNLCC